MSVVHSQKTLIPVYKIPAEQLTPSLLKIPLLNECINDFKFQSKNSKSYIGLKIDENKFIYAELDKKFNPDTECMLDDLATFNRNEIIFKSEENFMVLAHGSFLMENNEEFIGILILMQPVWKMDFLFESLTKFNISNVTTCIFEDSFKLRHSLNMDCKRFDKNLKKCEIIVNVDRSIEITVFSILSILLLVVFGVFAVFWYIKVNK